MREEAWTPGRYSWSLVTVGWQACPQSSYIVMSISLPLPHSPVLLTLLVSHWLAYFWQPSSSCNCSFFFWNYFLIALTFFLWDCMIPLHKCYHFSFHQRLCVGLTDLRKLKRKLWMFLFVYLFVSHHFSKCVISKYVKISPWACSCLTPEKFPFAPLLQLYQCK